MPLEELATGDALMGRASYRKGSAASVDVLMESKLRLQLHSSRSYQRGWASGSLWVHWKIYTNIHSSLLAMVVRVTPIS